MARDWDVIVIGLGGIGSAAAHRAGRAVPMTARHGAVVGRHA